MIETKYKSAYLLLTNACNIHCTFCYRRGLYDRNDVSKLGPINMSDEMAFKTMDFIFNELPLASRFELYFWGGEPLLKFDLMKKIVNAYPQIKYHTNTNGQLVTKEMYNFFMENRCFVFTWSMGSAYERFGGVKQAVEAMPLTNMLVKDAGFAVNFMVTNFENMFEDFEYLFENVTRNITIDIATRKEHTADDLEIFADQYLKILDKYSEDSDTSPIGFKIPSRTHLNIAYTSNLWFEKFGPKTLIRDGKFCNSGLERLFFDQAGKIWQCDGMYVCQHNMLGTIETGIDYSKLSRMIELREEPSKMLQYCEDCEIFGYCPRNKCLGLNLEYMGDMLKTEPSYCKANKALFRVIQRYIEKEEIRRLGQKVNQMTTEEVAHGISN